MTNTFQALMGKKTPELLELYNTMAEGTRNAQLSSWKQAKEGLVNRIIGMGYVEKSFDLMGTDVETVTEEPVADLTGKEVWDSTPSETDEERAEREEQSEAPKRTVKQACIELLCHVDHYENRSTGKRDDGPNFTNCRSVGLSYAEILRRLREEFPDCATKAESLRWYAVKMRTGEHGFAGHTLPQKRPQERKPK